MVRIAKKSSPFLLLAWLLSISLIILCSLNQLLARLAAQPLGTEVKIVNNPRTPAPRDGKKKKLVFEEELTIGVVEGDENYLFGGDIIFNTDDEGNFYVSDWQKLRIQKYNPDGKYLLSIGKQGQGPGEFGNLSVVRFDRRGLLYVTDLANRRINFFDREGNFMEQINLPDVFENLYLNSRGRLVAVHTASIESKSGFSAFKQEYGIFDSQGKLLTEFYSMIKEPKPPEGRDATSIAKFMAGLLSDMVSEPQPTYLVADNDYIYFGAGENYLIDVFNPDGKKVMSIRRDYDPITYSDKDKENFIREQAEDFLRRYPEEMRKEIYKFIKFPKYKPSYSNFALMENGWLVVEANYVAGQPTLFDLFDKDGIYIGQFKAGVPGDYFFFKNGKAYALATQDLYKFVKRYRFKIVEE